MNLRHMLLSAVVGLCVASTAGADVRFANIFSDNMVLQREKPVRIWGWAQPGEQVTVTITDSRDEAIAKAGAETINPPTADADDAKGKKGKKGEPEQPEYKVRMSYEESNAPAFKTVEAKAKAGDDGLWVVEVGPLVASFQPKYVIAAGASGKAALKNVLVGEVWVCAGQSNMFYSGDRSKWLDSEGLLPSGVRYAHTGRNSAYKPLGDLAGRVDWFECTEDNTRGISTIPYLFGKFLHNKLGVPVGIINAASGGAMGNYWCSLAELHGIDFGPVKEMMKAYDDGVAQWEDPAGRKKLIDAYEKKYAEEHAQWVKDAAEAKANKKKAPKEPRHNPPKGPVTGGLPSYLYNARIVPIGRLAVRGAIYLQGEQQTLTMHVAQYRYTFPAVIRSFRAVLGKDLAFGIITLQGGGHTKGNLGEMDMCDRTSIVREIHYKTHLATPGTGFICAADVGQGLHPSYKRPVAERAAWWALRDIYKAVPDKRTVLQSVEYKDGRAYVHIATRSVVQEKDRKTREVKAVVRESPVKLRRWSSDDTYPITGFAIAGADRRWYPAKVVINPDNVGVIELYSDLCDKPVAVRYGWGGYPHANVGTWMDPLPPFRTDDWPLPKAQDLTPEEAGQSRTQFYECLNKGFRQMLDRMIRQGRFDGAIGEIQLKDSAAGILESKADRIEAILNETNPDFYHSWRLQWRNDDDWTLERVGGPIVEKVPAKAKELDAALKDKEVAESLANLRKALGKYRKAVAKQIKK